MFSIEYVKGAIRTYTSTERDSLIASVLDGVRASGNRDVCVKMTFTDRGKRLGTFTCIVGILIHTFIYPFLYRYAAVLKIDCWFLVLYYLTRLFEFGGISFI